MKAREHNVSTIILILAGIATYICWPGILRSDSDVQYAQVLGGGLLLGDHNPPMMVLYWRLMNYIYPGPGLMLATQMLLYWGSVWFFAKAFNNIKYTTSIIAISLLPPVICYSPFILKDISFTCSFLFVAAWLSYSCAAKQKPSLLGRIIILIVMFYGTTVKYQAIFALPFLWLWFCYTANFTFSKKTILWAIISYLAFFSGIQTFNRLTSIPGHSWQYVKLYDLAAISLQKNTTIFPKFILEYRNFSMQRVKETYDSQRVDELALYDSSPLKKSNHAHERKELLSLWKSTIVKHPKEYLTHRLNIFKNLITKTPFKTFEQLSYGNKWLPARFITVFSLLEKTIIPILKNIFIFAYFLPLLPLYMFFAIRSINHCRFAVPLLGLTCLSASLLGAMFIFSMASDPRYIYLSVCCLHFAHPFFIKVIKQH